MADTIDELGKLTAPRNESLLNRVRRRHARLQPGQWRSPGLDAAIITDDKNKKVLVKPDIEGTGYAFTEELAALPGSLSIGGPPSALRFVGDLVLNDQGLTPSTILTPTPMLLPGSSQQELESLRDFLTPSGGS